MKSLLLPVAIAAILMMGCTGQNSPSPAQADPTWNPPIAWDHDAVLPALPVDADMKLPSSIKTSTIDGSNPMLKSLNTNVLGLTLQLQPMAGDISFAVYGLNVGGYAVSKLSMDANLTAASKSWLLFANYETGHWTAVSANAINLANIQLPPGILRSPLGNFYVGLLCYDSAPATITSITIETRHADWVKHLIYGAGPGKSLGYRCKATLVNDRLYVLFTESEGLSKQLLLARCTTSEPEATVQWRVSTVDAGTYLYDSYDIASVDDLPGVSWFYYDTKTQWYGRAKSPTPAEPGDWVFNNLETVDHIGLLSLAEINGRPAVVYAMSELPVTSVVRYAYATKARPASNLDWVVTNCFSSASNFIGTMELASIDGNPTLAVYESGALNYFLVSSDSQTPTGEANWQVCLIDNFANHVNGNIPSISLLEHNGLPTVLYQSRELGLMYAQADRLRPFLSEQWSSHQIFSNVENVSGFALTNEGLLGCYLYNPGGTLLGILANSAEPVYRRDWRAAQIFSGNPVGSLRPAALATSAGTPVIFYYDETAEELYCARYNGM